MKIPLNEQRALKTVLALGAEHGYGNLIVHLQTAWARQLMTDHGMQEKAARACSLGPGMPFLMQDDLLQRGEWDETGQRYAAKGDAR